MKKYFIAEDNQQIGPLSMDELRVKGISQSSLVWFEGMANWQEASTVAELNELFYVAPTPPPTFQTPPPQAAYQAPQQPAGAYQQANPYSSNPFQQDVVTGNPGGGMIAMGYILALLGGLGGIVVGSILWMAKEKVNGTKMKKFDQTSQMHGVFAFFLGIIVWAAVVQFWLV